MMKTRGVMRVIEPIIAGAIKKGTSLDFEKLKHVLER